MTSAPLVLESGEVRRANANDALLFALPPNRVEDDFLIPENRSMVVMNYCEVADDARLSIFGYLGVI